MGSSALGALGDVMSTLNDLLEIVLSVVKGNLSELSSEGSLAGIFGSTDQTTSSFDTTAK